MNPNEFRTAFINWVALIKNLMKNKIVAVDGKTLRGSQNKKNGKSAIHMVSAWASEVNMVLGQVKTEEKSNEITAIPQLLNLLDISGCVVTIDAMVCQKKLFNTLRFHQMFFAVHSEIFPLQCSYYYLLTQVILDDVWR